MKLNLKPGFKPVLSKGFKEFLWKRRGVCQKGLNNILLI
jgi:hypothetical protein